MAALYRPSCGSEGADFIHRWCYNCRRDAAFRNDEGDSCPIVANSLALAIDHKDYPREWTFDETGAPICTAFEDEREPPPQDPRAAIRDLFGAP